MKILIDPGHGRNTAGKRSPDGRFLEYKFNRQVSNLIVADLLVSIHANAFGDGHEWTKPSG